MTAKLAMFMVLAAGVAGCARNPPPPPPMAMAPEPPPMPAPEPVASGPVDGIYRGTSEATGQLARGCARPGPITINVARNNTFTVKGIRGRISPDGVVSHVGRGASLSGTVQNGNLDVTTTGRCEYHVTATKS